MEKWIKWEPITNLSDTYYIDSIIDNCDGFKIILSESKNEHNKLTVTFESSVDFYSKTDETFVGSIINELNQSYGTKFYSEWTFFKRIDSDYIKQLSKQSSGIADSRGLIHFSFIAADSLLDVIASYEPKVERISHE